MNRRKFLNKLAFGSLTGAGILGTLGAVRLTYPDISQKQKYFRVGRPDDFPLHTFTFIKQKNVFVYRDRTSMKTVSAICTHLGCVLKKSDAGFRCPCHGSNYNGMGEVLSGPAPRNLDWLKMEFSHDGQLVVLPRKKVPHTTKLML